MKTIIAFIFTAFFASATFAQTGNQQQLPPLMQTDTTSGWQLVFSNPRYSIGGLQYLGENTVYATAYNKSILLLMRSFDGGVTWDTLTTPIPTGYVTFTSPKVGYSVPSSPNVVWKTTDGGQSWVAHDRKSTAFGPIAFSNKDTGIVIAPDAMTRTSDGGATWTQLFPPNSITKEAACFGDASTGYAVGDATGIAGHPEFPNAGYCQKTTDGGATWKQIYTGMPGALYSCIALDANILIVGSDSKIGRTLNGGASWDTSTYLGLFESISFADKAHGLIVGADGPGSKPYGVIYSTTDTAKSWHKQYIPNAPWLLSVQMINDSIALTCGGGNIYRTTSSGNFSSVTQHTIDFHVKTFPNPTTGNVTIQYQLPTSQSVSFIFYNIQGATVGNINSGIQNPGSHQVNFEGAGLANGVYYFRLTTPQDSFTGSFTIQK